MTAALLGAPMEEEEDDEDFDASKVEAPDSSGGESEADDSEGDFDEDAPADGAVKKTKKKKKVKKKRDEGALALRGELRCDAEVWRWSGVWATSEAVTAASEIHRLRISLSIFLVPFFSLLLLLRVSQFFGERVGLSGVRRMCA